MLSIVKPNLRRRIYTLAKVRVLQHRARKATKIKLTAKHAKSAYTATGPEPGPLDCAAPARGGAFADERRVVAGNTDRRARHRRACAPLVASFAAVFRCR